MTDGTDTGADRSPLGDGTVPVRLAHRLRDELRHRADLALFAAAEPVRWTDALLAATRFHLAGTMNALEMAIRLEIADTDVAGRLNGLPQPHCFPALERHIDLLSPELIGHLRLRGALSVILRGQADPAHPGIDGIPKVEAGDGPAAQALAALTLAEQSWSGAPLLDAVLPADLPAEPYCDLGWTTAALLIRGMSPEHLAIDQSTQRAIVRAVERVMAGHDEGIGPFALARRCARALSEAERLELAPLALAERRLLLFCALAEAETSIAIDVLLGALIDNVDETRHALLRLMGIDEVLAVHVHELLAPLTGGLADDHAALVAFVENYRSFDRPRAEAWLERMLRPPELVARLAIIDSVS